MVIFEMRYAWGTTHPIWVRHCSSHFYCDQTATYTYNGVTKVLIQYLCLKQNSPNYRQRGGGAGEG